MSRHGRRLQPELGPGALVIDGAQPPEAAVGTPPARGLDGATVYSPGWEGSGGPPAALGTGPETPGGGEFRSQVARFLEIVDAPVQALYRRWPFDGVPGGLSKGQTHRVLKAEATLRGATLSKLVRRLQALLDSAVERRVKRGSGDLTTFVARLTGAVSFVEGSRAEVLRVCQDRLAGLYPGRTSTHDPPDRVAERAPRAPDEGAARAPVRRADGRVLLVVAVPDFVWELPPGEGARYIARLVEAEMHAGTVRPLAIQEGCTEIVLDLSRGQADAIRRAYDRGDLAAAGVLAIREIDAPPGLLARLAWMDGPRVDAAAPDADARLADFWRRAVWRESLVRPLRRLRWLFSPSVRFSPIAHVIGASERDAYATAGPWKRARASHRRSRAVVLGRAVWPLLTAALLVATLTALRATGVPVSIGLGVAAGFALSVAGAQVCASVVSPLAVGAGGIGMAWAFGIAQAVVIGRFGTGGPLGRHAVQQDPFTAVTGGALGLSAPAWTGTFPLGAIAALLLVVAAAIATAGWLMAQPARADGVAVRGAGREVAGAIGGSLAGAGIALVYGLSAALRASGLGGPSAFSLAFAVVGGASFGAAVWLTTRSGRRAVAFAGLLAGAALLLFEGAFGLAGTGIGLVLLAGATGLYHATWFTMAFVVGRTIGSPRAAVVATALEGAVGFTAFVLWRMLHG